MLALIIRLRLAWKDGAVQQWTHWSFATASQINLLKPEWLGARADAGLTLLHRQEIEAQHLDAFWDYSGWQENSYVALSQSAAFKQFCNDKTVEGMRALAEVA